jgi:hypothetical protein
MVLALVQAVIALVVAFGLQLAPEDADRVSGRRLGCLRRDWRIRCGCCCQGRRPAEYREAAL